MTILLAQLTWAAPMWLFGLLLIPALFALWFLKFRDTKRRGQLFSLVTRCLVLVALVAACAQPQWLSEQRRSTTVLVQDISQSVGDVNATEIAVALESSPGDFDLRQIAFAGEPSRVNVDWNAALRDAPTNETNLEEALLLAKGLIPGGHQGSILLASDGLATTGRTMAAVGNTGPPISIRPQSRSKRDEIAIASIETPVLVRPHERLPVTVNVVSTYAANASLQIFRNGQPTISQQVQLKVGLSEYTFDLAPPIERPIVIQAIVTSAADHWEDNNRASSVVLPGARRQIMVVSSEPPADQRFAEMLTQLGFEVRVTTPQELASEMPFADSDLVILSNISAADLGDDRIASLERFVQQQGGGLLVMGGQAAFGVEALKLTRLEQLLPVAAIEEQEEKQKSLAMVLVIDKSLSMLDDRRLALAKEAAKQVAGVLNPRDQVGVLAFGSETQWISQLAPLDNRDELLRRIDGLQAKGLTNMYPALMRAYLALSQTEADSRNVILLTDGVPTPGEFRELAKKMGEANITISTVSLSAGADQTILKDIAAAAKGTHHHADNPEALPQILVRETKQAVSQVSEQLFKVNSADGLPGLSTEGAPELSGYAATAMKEDADLLVRVGDNDPLLAKRQMGKGVVLAFTTDLSSSDARAWYSWSGLSAFWLDLVQHALRPERTSPLDLQVQFEHGQVTATLDALEIGADGKFFHANGKKAKLVVAPVNSTNSVQPLELPLDQIAPGLYQATWPIEVPMNLVLDAQIEPSTSQSRSAERGFSVSYGEEFRLAPPDVPLLKKIAETSGGQYDVPFDTWQPRDGSPIVVSNALWPWVVLAALLLFLVDVAIYRRRSSHWATSH